MQPIPKARFEQFSDGVFAIAITLLAFELRVVHLTSPIISSSLRELIPLIPIILTFVLSFITIAIFWVNHHQLTDMLSTINKRRILWGNMLFLLFVTLIPFASQTIGQNPLHPLAMLTYCLVLFGASVSFSAVRYNIHRSLGEEHVPQSRSVLGPVIYLLAAFVCIVSVRGSYALLLIPPLYYFLPKSHPDMPGALPR
jgi:uncharacterized membrane protein